MLYSLGHYRSHGFALLVGILAFPVFAQWSGNDSYRLDQIYLQLGGDYNSSHSIHSDLTEILSFQRRAYNLSTNTYRLLDTFLADFRSVLNPDLQGRYSSVRVDLVLDGYTPYVHRELPYDPRISAELLVTNRAETYWLEKIYNAVSSNRVDLASLLATTPLTSEGYMMGADWFDVRDYYLKDFCNFYADPSKENFLQLAQNWSFSSSFPFLLFGLLNWEDLYENDRDVYFNLSDLLIAANGSGEIYSWDPISGSIGKAFNRQYGTYLLTSNSIAQLSYMINNGGLSDNVFTNLFTADGTIENTDNSFTNSSSVFNKFATSFLPSGLFDPEEVDTNLFEYADADISPNPTFNPRPLQGGTRSRTSASFDYDFDDSQDYSYNLVNPLKTATDQVQNDTDIDNKFQTLADLVNQRISSIFDSPLTSISQQPSRWSVKFRDKDGNSLEEYVSSQQSETSDGITFVCWVIESTMFAGFFFTCVRRSLRIGFAGDSPT